MSGYGWSPSGNGNPNGFYRGPQIYHSNSVQEHCVICHHVFYSIEALINHYDNHIRENELNNRAMREGNFPTSQTLGQNNYVRGHNQMAPQAQRSLAFGGGQNQPLLPQGLPFARASHTVIQQRQTEPAINQAQRRQNFAPANRPATATVAQPNQHVSVSDEIDLDFGEEENNNADRSINLDLTLG